MNTMVIYGLIAALVLAVIAFIYMLNYMLKSDEKQLDKHVSNSELLPGTGDDLELYENPDKE